MPHKYQMVVAQHLSSLVLFLRQSAQFANITKLRHDVQRSEAGWLFPAAVFHLPVTVHRKPALSSKRVSAGLRRLSNYLKTDLGDMALLV